MLEAVLCYRTYVTGTRLLRHGCFKYGHVGAYMSSGFEKKSSFELET